MEDDGRRTRPFVFRLSSSVQPSGMQQIFKRLSALSYLARPLALAFIGIVFLSFGATYFAVAIYRTSELPALFYYITLQFLERWMRGVIFSIIGLAVLLVGIWRLSGV